MNSEQLKKINELVKQTKECDDILKKCCGDEVLMKFRQSDVDITWVNISKDTANSIVTAYRDKLKAELKELGYEE